MHEQLTHFHDEVVLKYHLYNSLFLTLPFGGTEEAGTLLSVFSKYCQEQIVKGKNPKFIVSSFFKKHLQNLNEHDELNALFRMLQFVERQIVLFDALEDAAFAQTHDLNGPGSLHHLILKTINRQQQQNFAQQIRDYQIKIVLTAHPTQFYPHPILGILAELSPALRNNDLKQISLLLLQMGKTSFKYRHKPTPLQEAKSLIWFLEKIFYRVIPEIQTEINQAILDFATAQQPLPKCIELGFWPGGDRDGNPFVTAQTTITVAQQLKSRILRLYLLELRHLVTKLTFAGVLEKLEEIKHKVENSYFASQIQANAPASPVYETATDLIFDLECIRRLLIDEHNSLFLEILDQFISKVRCFGFYFAAMDMRENATIHREVLGLMLKDLAKNSAFNTSDRKRLQSYPALNFDEKSALLTQIIAQQSIYTLPQQPKNQMLVNTVQSLQAIPLIQAQNGEQGLCRYIISNTDSAAAVLEVLALLHLAGQFPDQIKVDIIPLFESITDLEHCAKSMNQLYQNESYRAHLRQRGNQQVIMLGFSDGTKDGGYVTANWSIYKAKLLLTESAKQHDITITFFDGRGGPPARGGGNTHAFYRSLGKKIKHRRPQLTIQGQTISTNFGTFDSAKYNLEQLLTSGLEDLIFPDATNDLTATEIALLEELSQASKNAYLALKNHPLFIPYLEQMTPLRFFNELNIGSRPSSRKKTAQLQFSDLRAIPFVSAWSQLKQNIPGYYGFGSALQQLIQQQKKADLIALYQHSLFFRTLVENAMMSLSKTYFRLTAYMKTDNKFGEFWRKLAAENELTKKLLLEISGQKCLLETDPLNRESIKLREEIVLPLLIIQQYAMIRLQELADDSSDLSIIYKKIILKALAANTNASRNAV